MRLNMDKLRVIKINNVKLTNLQLTPEQTNGPITLPFYDPQHITRPRTDLTKAHEVQIPPIPIHPLTHHTGIPLTRLLKLPKVNQHILQQRPIPQHHSRIRRDARQACDRFIVDYKMKQQLNLTEQERVFILVAAYAHDNGHQGLTNNFYINSEDQLAIKYSNISPLENMHSSNLLHCLRLNNITVTQQHKQLMVSLILATDNKHHFQLLHKIQQYQKYVNNKIIENLHEDSQEANNSTIIQQNNSNKKHRQTLLEMIIHTADLNPCGKPVQEYLKWNQRLYDQFKTQYKKERELKLPKYSFNFDLTNEEYSLANENLNFLNKMVLPFFKQVSIVMPPFWTELTNAISIRNHFQAQLNSISNKKQLKDKKQPSK